MEAHIRQTVLAVIAAIAMVVLVPAAAGAQVQPYRANDPGGFRDVLPPGTNGLANGPSIANFLGSGARPPHNDDQLGMYRDLVYATPGLKVGDLGNFFKDASFGVPEAEVSRAYNPHPHATVLRDRGFGVPHVYSSSREGAMFSLGYVAAEDRLFFIDILRHVGRAQLSSFAGGAPGNRAFDREQWKIAPYTEADLERQIDLGVEIYGERGRKLKQDAEAYVAGINSYISEARLDPNKMPGEYAAINRPQGPDSWKLADLIATASLVGGFFGKGGGGEVDSALTLQAAEKRFGKKRGRAVWGDFRSADDPEAPRTIHKGRFRYQREPKRPRGVAMPDPGSVNKAKTLVSTSASGRSRTRARGLLDGLRSLPQANSNALLVSGRESRSGRPLAVFGPQTGYFAPQILMEQDVHAPGIDARGAAFPGVNLFVQLGRGRDYAWSATSAGQDNIDTFALRLCEPDGSEPSLESMHYRYRGACQPIEVLRRTNSWSPNAADDTPSGTETLEAQRTQLGIVTARATVKGKPVIYTKLRSTYFHEVDSAAGFSDLNNPDKIKGPRDFQRATHQIGYTFNWFYADSKRIAYFNSGNNPVRGKRVSASFPVWGLKRFEWKEWEPERWTARMTPLREHPRVVDQAFLASWNNKQARGYSAADNQWGWSATHRVKPLEDRIRHGIRGKRKMTLTQLVEAMAESATVDLRGDAVLPYALRVLGRQRDPVLADAVAKLRAWKRSGAQRRDRNRDGFYEHSEAIQIMDAWWPLWVEAQFKPALGEELYGKVLGMTGLDNHPNNNGEHVGSAWQDKIYGHARKDLRRILGLRVRGRFSRTYCGRGNVRRCRIALATSLRKALQVDRATLYGGDSECTGTAGIDPQWCFDSIRFRPLGAITQPLIHWQNRPTYQQIVEVQGTVER